MRPRMRWVGALASVVMLSTVSPSAALAARAETPPVGSARQPLGPAPGTRAAPATDTRTITLITGDEVVVRAGDPAEVLRIRPGRGRAETGFVTSRAGGRLRVVPADALALVNAGRLDPRLFDLTGLLAAGYDDRRADLPLILMGGGASGRPGTCPGMKARLALPGGTAVRVARPRLGAMWAGMAGALARTRSAGATKVWLDGLRRPALTESVPRIGAPEAWAAGRTGAGVKVGVIDTGVDGTHRDLAGRVVAARAFTEDGHTRDLIGHGTHVAATIASSGAAPGGYRGVAPGARIVSAKVCSADGCSDSAILAGLQWAADQGAKVVNMSLGGTDTPGQDPLEAAVQRLTAAKGILFVVSAGNAGEAGDSTVESPGSAGAALTVGAVTKSDVLAPFSSRGPRVGDAALKPDLTAPGVDIVAAVSRESAGEADAHATLSGTSMAAPHVAGAAAVLAQHQPRWTPAQLKAALMGGARPQPGTGIFAQAAGRVDVGRALRQTVLAVPSSLSFGRQLWPHHDDKPVARTVTYRNTGRAAVTLRLAIGGKQPAGMFALSAATVTVPAGGTAGVTVTARTRVAGPDGFHGGYLTATGGGQVVSTPFAVDKEAESYTVKITHRDSAGKPTDDYMTNLVHRGTGKTYSIGGGATVTVRLPKGAYAVGSGTGSRRLFLVVDSAFVVDRNRNLTLDARAAKPVRVTVPHRDARQARLGVDAFVSFGARSVYFGVEGSATTQVHVGPVNGRTRDNRTVTRISGNWVKGPAGDAPVLTSPYLYSLSWLVKRRVPAGATRRFTAGELATVRADYAGQGVPEGFFITSAVHPEMLDPTPAVQVKTRLPGTIVEYYSTGDRVGWLQDVWEGQAEIGKVVSSTHAASLRTYRAGRGYAEQRNRAVFGPGVASPFGPSAYRAGDIMVFTPRTHAPAGGWTERPASDLLRRYRTVVERDGVVIADVPHLLVVAEDLPAAEAEYRVRAESTRTAPSVLSTSVTCTWTFRSGRTAADAPAALPISAVRFTPPLDRHNAAPAGARWPLPLEVERQPGSKAGAVRTLTVDVSFDDGRTWRSTPVRMTGQRGLASVLHPGRPGFVSLRAKATDTAGNTVTQAVIRAYRLR